MMMPWVFMALLWVFMTPSVVARHEKYHEIVMKMSHGSMEGQHWHGTAVAVLWLSQP